MRVKVREGVLIVSIGRVICAYVLYRYGAAHTQEADGRRKLDNQ